MRALAIGLVALVIAFAGFARADDKAKDLADIQAIISQQLDAFARDDAKAAYALAAPAIQEKFGDAEAFMAMVKSVYPPVYKRRSVEFGKQLRDGGAAVQDVVFVDADNDVWKGAYKVELQAGGEWRITGCVLIRSDDSSL